MKVEVHEVTEITRKLDITVPAADLEQELEKVYREIGKEAKLPGFRPGKIPRDVLEKHFKKEAEADAVKHLVSSTYPEALQAADISPVSYPQISIRKFQPGEDLVYEATVEIPPQVTIRGYDSLALTGNKVKVTEEELETGLKALQERTAQLVPPSELRKPRQGDVVVFDYQGSQDGKELPQAKGSGQMAEVGAGHLNPLFEGALMEMMPGEKKRVPVALSPETPDQNRTLHYDVTLREVKEKRLPELNDDFAKDLGNFTTLVEVKEKIREQIEKEKGHAEQAQLGRQAIEKLIEKNRIPVPEGMIQVELEAMFRNFEAQLRGQGLTLEKTGITPEQFAEKNREEARFRVLGGLILDAIATEQGMTVSPTEVEERITQLAKQAGQSPDAWNKYYREKNLLGGVEAGIREEKTLAFVLSKATIKIEE